MTPRLIVRSLLALALAGLLVLGAMTIAGAWQPRVSPVAFLLLLSAELVLLDAAASERPAVAFAARLAVFALPLALALGLRFSQALSPDVLEWDETYYMSLAVTAADGRGLYPYIFGYGEMPIMGGVGYAAYAYALAVRLAGPTVLGLRVVSLVAAAAGLAFIWLLVRKWYGSGTAWIAVALTSALRLFVMSNSVRMDSLTFACVSGGLLATAIAFERWSDKRWHAFAGLVFGLGLQAHIDTIVTAVACGVVYLVWWLREIKDTRRARLPAQMLAYAGGWSVGLALFVVFNILPDPDAFYRTTVLIRVDATRWYSSGTSSIFGSFLDPRILGAKELERYTVLSGALPRIEIVLAFAAIVAMAVRRGLADRLVFTMAVAVVIVASVVLNNASPLYFIHVLPALLVPIAPLFTHGLTRRTKVSVRDVGLTSMIAFVVVVSALCAVNSAKTVSGSPSPAERELADAEFARRVRSAAPHACRIAGDGGLYVRYFADYPYFISTRPTEVSYAMLYFGLGTEADYWAIKAPEVVFAREALSDGLSSHLAHAGMRQVGEGVWAVSGGCLAAARQSR